MSLIFAASLWDRGLLDPIYRGGSGDPPPGLDAMQWALEPHAYLRHSNDHALSHHLTSDQSPQLGFDSLRAVPCIPSLPSPTVFLSTAPDTQ